MTAASLSLPPTRNQVAAWAKFVLSDKNSTTATVAVAHDRLQWWAAVPLVTTYLKGTARTR